MRREIDISLEHLASLVNLFWPNPLVAKSADKSHQRLLGAHTCVALADKNGLVVGKSEKVAAWYNHDRLVEHHGTFPVTCEEREKAVRGIY